MTGTQAVEKMVAVTGAGMRDRTPRVFVLSSATGGAGGGMAVGMAYAVRQVLGELGQSVRGLCGMFLYATSPKPTDQEMARVNACATLTELAQFSLPDFPYPGDPDYGLHPFGNGHAPFEECYLVHLGEQLSGPEAEAATDKLAEYLFLDASPNGGAFLDQFRRQTHAGPREPFTLRSFGLSRIGTEGERPLEMATRLLCLRLTEKWLAGPKEAEGKYLEREAQRQAAALGLAEEALVARVQTAVAPAPGEDQDTYVATLLTKAAEVAGSDLPVKMLGPLDRALAVKTETREGPETGGSPLQAAVRKAAAEGGAEIGRSLLDWLTRLIETPGKRFKGAERAATFLVREAVALAEKVRGRLTQVGAHRRELRQQMETEKPGGAGAGLGWLGRALGRAAMNPEDKLRAYCRLWLQEAAEAGALAVLGIVEKDLGEFLKKLAPVSAADRKILGCVPPDDAERLAAERRDDPLAAPTGKRTMRPKGPRRESTVCRPKWCSGSTARSNPRCWNGRAECGAFFARRRRHRQDGRRAPADPRDAP